MDASSIPDTASISARSHVVSTAAGGEVVILDPPTGRYYSLDGVGAFVWGLIDGSVALVDLRDAVVESYDVEPDAAIADLKALLCELSAFGLIDVVDAPPR